MLFKVFTIWRLDKRNAESDTNGTKKIEICNGVVLEGQKAPWKER